MSLLERHRAFLAATVDHLATDERVAAVVLTGSGGRGEADEWSDLDINVIVDNDASEAMLSCAASAEDYGDLAVWVDCSFNAPPKGAMSFARYLVGDDLVLVDWHVWPVALARSTSGSSILWARPDLELKTFDGTLVDLTSSQTLRKIPPYSRQQRAEWDLCMLQIAASRPARHEDASAIGAHLGLTFPAGSTATTQLEVLDRHLESLQPWVAPRAWNATRRRFDVIRETL
jgi:predicted nucleotidyltransferase